MSKPERELQGDKRQWRYAKEDLKPPGEHRRHDKAEVRRQKLHLSGGKLHLRCPKGDLRSDKPFLRRLKRYPRGLGEDRSRLEEHWRLAKSPRR